MRFNCCLSIFGVTDAEGIREIFHHRGARHANKED